MDSKIKTPNNAKPRGKATVKPAVARSRDRGRGLKKTPSDNSRHPKAPVLTPEARVRVVELLACYRTPSVIKRTIEQEFGVSVTLAAINYYNPDLRYKENPFGSH